MARPTDEGERQAVLIAPHELTAVVLCGGESRRMGGVEKPLLDFHGRSLLDHVLDRVMPQVGRVVISANRARERYAARGCAVVADVVPGLGPLGGVASCAAIVATPWMFVCPGDAPLLDPSLVARLAAAIGPTDSGAYPHDGQRSHFLFLLVRTAACASIADYLSAGGRSVHGWLATRAVREVPLPELRAGFANINTPPDLRVMEAPLRDYSA